MMKILKWISSLTIIYVIVFLVVLIQLSLPMNAQWHQWGGPNRTFTADVKGLAESWPEKGPAKLWYRALGDGYSAIVADNGILYTQYRKNKTDDTEYTVALDASTGKTLWEHMLPSPQKKPVDPSGWGGHGPNSTPLIVGDHLYTVSSLGKIHCYDKKKGAVLWKRNLLGEKVTPDHVGYCFSPIAYGNSVITLAFHSKPADGKNKHSIIALNQADGKILWECDKRFRTFHSSPILIKYRGKDQLVFCDHNGILGINPQNGRIFWELPIPGSIVTPVWNGGDLIFYSSGGSDAPGLVIRLSEKDGKTVAEKIWKNKKAAIWQPTPVKVGDFLYGSTRKKMIGVNFKTGEITWSESDYPMAACVYGDEKLIILDQDGYLTLAVAAPSGLTVHSRCKITEKYSYTVPTLVGKTLYVRDRKHIMALDLAGK
jgi:outer membrane protein assembly factor BamB